MSGRCWECLAVKVEHRRSGVLEVGVVTVQGESARRRVAMMLADSAER